MKKLIFIMMVVGVMALVLRCHAVATDADPQATASMTSNMAVAELEAKGDVLRRDKDYEQALRMYRAALRKQPKNPVLFNKIGLAELQRGNLVAAQENFQKAVKQDKKFAEAHNNVGAVLYMQKKYDSAVKAYKKALALQEENATFHTNLAAAWFDMKMVDRAMAEYTRALELDPDVVARHDRGGISARIPSPEEAAQYQYLLAKVYAKRGDMDRAFECLHKAKELGYGKLSDVYADPEFAVLRQDARLIGLVPAPARP